MTTEKNTRRREFVFANVANCWAIRCICTIQHVFVRVHKEYDLFAVKYNRYVDYMFGKYLEYVMVGITWVIIVI